MGNYSYLLYMLNAKNAIIDKDTLMKKINADNSEDYIYTWSDDFKNVKTIEDLANYKHDQKFIGYITPETINTLCKISLYTKYNEQQEDKTQHPRIYFEYEGWDEIYFIEFHLGTEKVLCGSHAFDFNQEYYDKLYNNTDGENWEAVNKIKNEYMLNLIFDKFTKWNIRKLDYNHKITKEQEQLSLIMMLAGLRKDDIELEPEKFTELFGKKFS